MEVDVLHGQHLGVAAAGRAALDPEHRAQGGLPQGDDGVFADFGHGLAQARRGGGLPLTGGSGIDGRYQHQLAVGLVLQALEQGLVQLGLVAAVELQLLLFDAQFFRDLDDGL